VKILIDFTYRTVNKSR